MHHSYTNDGIQELKGLEVNKMRARSILLVSIYLTILLPQSSFAVFPDEIEKLKAQCEKDKAETLSTLVVPQSCQRLRQGDEPWQYQSGKNARRNAAPDGWTYEWNGGLKKYCYYNKAHVVQSCS